jgi:hypothetical protein
MPNAAAHKFKTFAIMDRRHGKGVPVILEGGPLDGLEETMPMLAAGLLAVQSWPHGDDGGTDYFYCRTRQRDPARRVICRFTGRRVRG